MSPLRSSRPVPSSRRSPAPDATCQRSPRTRNIARWPNAPAAPGTACPTAGSTHRPRSSSSKSSTPPGTHLPRTGLRPSPCSTTSCAPNCPPPVRTGPPPSPDSGRSPAPAHSPHPPASPDRDGRPASPTSRRSPSRSVTGAYTIHAPSPTAGRSTRTSARLRSQGRQVLAAVPRLEGATRSFLPDRILRSPDG